MDYFEYYNKGSNVDEFYRWMYDESTGFIRKGAGGTEKDHEQDQEIEANKEKINEAFHDIEQNNELDERQQQQLDLNDANDERQQSEIDSLNTSMEENRQLDEEQQRLIDENYAIDSAQQQQINSNMENITRVEGEITDYSVDGTTFVIKKRKET